MMEATHCAAERCSPSRRSTAATILSSPSLAHNEPLDSMQPLCLCVPGPLPARPPGPGIDWAHIIILLSDELRLTTPSLPIPPPSLPLGLSGPTPTPTLISTGGVQSQEQFIFVLTAPLSLAHSANTRGLTTLTGRKSQLP